MKDHAIFTEIAGHVGPRREDVLLDYAGAEFLCTWDNQSHVPAVDGQWQLPIPPIDEEYFEWVDLLESVRDARGAYTMMELGAGYGRWRHPRG